MNPIWSSAFAAARRALHVGDRRRSRRGEPMWRLLWDELVHGVERLRRPRR